MSRGTLQTRESGAHNNFQRGAGAAVLFILGSMGLAVALEPQEAQAQAPTQRSPAQDAVLDEATVEETGMNGPGIATSEVCSRCHSTSPDAVAMRDARGRPIAPFDLWQSTMMANAARDPFWRAVMSAEIAATPNAKDAIIAKCLKCHTPLAERYGLDDHDTGDLRHALDCDGELGELARDGVSCTICHGISGEGLGSEESFTAGFKLNRDLHLYGPHDEVFPRPMEMVSGFTPHYGAHMTRSKLCGSCHTLVTDALAPDGEAVGMQLHEQTPYLEWRNSAFSDEAPDGTLIEPRPEGARTCQSCHMPTVDEDGQTISTRLAHNPFGFDFGFVSPRSPFGRHLFVGGNAFMLTMFRDNAEALGVKAPRAAFDATIRATRVQLGENSATVKVSNARTTAAATEFDVVVTNLTGHKLPSGHPSRRMWLEVIAKNAEGDVVFASGRPNDDGLILGADGKVLPTESRGGPVEPHRSTVASPDQVARFRGVMGDAKGEPTYSLLRGATWHVDDRILPRGWRADHPDAESAKPYGTGDDSDFAPEGASAGTDSVTYRVASELGSVASVEVRLLYHTLSPRYVDEIAAFDTPEVVKFMALYKAADKAPEVLASTYWSKM